MRNITVAAAALAVAGLGFGFFTPAITGDAEPRLTSATAGEWSTTRYNRFGPWESICEVGEPMNDGNAERCYLRLLDRFSTGANSDAQDRFGTIAAYVSPAKNGLRVEFDLENGLSFQTDGFYLVRDGMAVWRLDDGACLESGVCSFTGPAADALVRAFSDQGTGELDMHVEFTDRYGQTLVRNWPMLPFAGAFADFKGNMQQAMM
ncbi:hypothetical protein [Hoeflea prorocentri]|uniref:Invasion associated locus B family protein n=1 Tax=Hoeflea prorocentri TaxID=1922333 RepID=A0A9X3ZHK2_9HYPH|nr:hypothetical protein [Hoeflea prorocentri]MCY6381013.1 hypothetical protein [Hoeflea prorocentri]MDA5398813.1 hypothetical protein [Hoeflea prorocentri]